MYTIEYTEGVLEDLAGMRAYQRTHIFDSIEAQLQHRPLQQTHNKKVILGLIPPWEYVEPVWQLRIGEYRVFYDVDEVSATVFVRAIRHKPPHKTTEEVL